MKLINNFDLEDIIINANGNINYKKVILNELKIPGIAFGLTFSLLVIMEQYQAIYNNIIFDSLWGMNNIIFRNLDLKLNKDKRKLQSMKTLLELCNQLNNLYIKTTPSMLAESSLSQIKYKVRLNEKKIPVIQQNKYFLVPTHDSLYNVKDTSILQEHIIGSKEYIISLESPKKSFQLRPAFNI